MLQKRVIQTIFVMFSCSLLIAGCFGSKSSDGPNRPPLAVNLAAETENNQSILIDVLANDSDPDGDTLTLVSVSAAEHGSVEIEGSQVRYTPAEGFAGVDSFSYVMTDGEFGASATVQISAFQTVILYGRVVDSPISEATVSVELGEQLLEAQSDENGFYELTLRFLDLSDTALLRLQATGSETYDQQHVTLSSRLLSASALLSLAGEGRELDREALHAVQVTQLSTARDVQLILLAGDTPLTEENSTAFEAALDMDLLLEMAAVIKLLIDDADFELPEPFDNLQDFLLDDDAYNSFVEIASEGGSDSPLALAMAATLSDPEVTPALSVAQLVGTFLEVEPTVPFMLTETGNYWSISESGITRVEFQHGNQGRFTVNTHNWQLTANEILIADEQLDGFRSVSDETSIGTLTDDPDIIAAWQSATGSLWGATRVRQFGVKKIQLLTASEQELGVRVHNFIKQAAFEFESDGITYITPEKITLEWERNVRLVRPQTLVLNNKVFDIEAESEWLLPDLQGGYSSDLYTLHADGTASTLTKQYQDKGWTLRWQLSDDGSALSLMAFDAGVLPVMTMRLQWYRDEAPALGMLTEYMNRYNESYVRIAPAMLAEGDYPTQQFVATADSARFQLMLLSLFRPVNWQDGEVLPTTWWFGWAFEPDGVGYEPSFLCDGLDDGDSSSVCLGDFTYKVARSISEWQLDGQRVIVERQPGCSVASPCNLRVLIPLHLGHHGIVSGIEYMTFHNAWNNTFSFLVFPRVNHWLEVDLPEPFNEDAGGMMSAAGLGHSRMLTGHRVVFPTQHPEMRQDQHHRQE